MALTREASKGAREGDGSQQSKNQSSAATDGATKNQAAGISQDAETPTSWTVQKLWQDTNQEQLVWLTEPPLIEDDDGADADTPQHAVSLLHRDIRRTGRHSLDTIVMRGSALRHILEDIIPNVSSYFDETEQGILMKAPFRLLFWHLEQIQHAAENADGDSREAGELLMNVLNEEFRTLITRRDRLIAQREMNFEVLWTLYKPGITCLTRADEHIVAVKVTSIHFSKDPMGKIYYRINHDTLVWDGLHFGWNDSYTDVYDFSGRKKLLDLDIYPIEFHEDQSIVEQLVARGRHFAQIAIKEPFLMSFNGEALDRESSPMWWQGEKKKKMTERVVLDARAYNHYFRRIILADKTLDRDGMKQALTSDTSNSSIFLFCLPELHCFALQTKKWARVWISDLDQVEYNNLAYPSLFLPNDYKELLLAFAEAQIDGYGFDDVIAGKGQGILMLLAGPPGTGKTLTAEAMAEHMKRPLYSVSAGELGATAGGMEHELDRVLELATRWNAVLLLDEADVFLERRTDTTDMARNKIVSVFLRKLEYYRGIMFLTTNRIHAIDDAFRSRIHIAIRYPDLDTPTRRSIWLNFLTRTADMYQFGVAVDSQELDELAQRKLNGREIRNIVKAAQLLASRTKQAVKKSHLDIVWRVEHEESAFLKPS